MNVDWMLYIPELISVSVIAIFMAVSPGADFLMVTRNSIFYGRIAGLYSSLGVSLAIWVHVIYSIAGLALIISKSMLLFSLVKYLGAAYLIYIGWKTFQSKPSEYSESVPHHKDLSHYSAFKIGFVSNALNPKTTLFFLSLFTQVVSPQTPLWLQLIYGVIISLAHWLWFSAVAMFLSQPALLKRFQIGKSYIEKVVGCLLMGLGVKVAIASHH